ncbi:MAG: hypothetical protein AB7L17_03335 [Ilumatobacteraceae bacterium]
MGIIRGFKDARTVLRSPRIQLRTDQPTVVVMPRPTLTGGGDAPSPDALEPIEGVTLDTYADIVRGISAYNYDQSMLPPIAARYGIAGDAWQSVHDGWNARIVADPAVARRFSDIYHGAA